MKTLLIGLLAFCTWSALSTYIYVCKIQGLCDAPLSTEVVAFNNNDQNIKDTLQNISAPVEVKMPEKLTIYFAFDKSEFNADVKTEKYFGESNDYLNQNPQAKLTITGHTDAIGSVQYNQNLGYRRAQSVQHYFEQLGMPLNKMHIASKGEEDPADNNTTAKGRSNNRRTEITIKK
ncbi:MAG: OmpA family protein [Prolixibacteraceae bacterium]|jgi:outer membrane protein OmpA-like peptidoglycan-associated protein|nr:OmpA family protein [Prolixibacteraceae bacterium]